MHPSLAWRSTILQIAWLGGVIALALSIKEPAIQYTLIGAFAGYGGALIQKARQSAAGGGDSGTPGSFLPGPMSMGASLPPGPLARHDAVNPLATTQPGTTVPAPKMLLLLALISTIFVLLPNCKGPSAPATTAIAEAGAPVAEGVCQLIENWTGSAGLESICASLPEIATIVATVVPLIALADREDAGHPREACKVIPTTTVCATPSQLHAGIEAVVTQRRSRFLVDAGLQ